jgi:hypothetical protein
MHPEIQQRRPQHRPAPQPRGPGQQPGGAGHRGAEGRDGGEGGGRLQDAALAGGWVLG